MQSKNQIEFRNINFLDLGLHEIEQVKSAITGDGDFYGYILKKCFGFILENFKQLSLIGVLEENWMQAYTHASHFNNTSLDRIQEIFDTCDKDILQEKYPIYVGDHFCNGKRFSLFRGCAGPNHKKGMSWTSSLDKAIWYATHHAEYYDIANMAVYASVVNRDDIYCCGNHYDYDFIVRPDNWWKIEIPQNEYRLSRPR